MARSRRSGGSTGGLGKVSRPRQVHPRPGRGGIISAMTPTEIQAVAAIASVVVAAVSLIVAIAAVIVAWKARGVASEGNAIARSAVEASELGVRESRRAARLADVPELALLHTQFKDNPQKFAMEVRNVGSVVAYGVLAWAAANTTRVFDQTHGERQQSGRYVALWPGENRLDQRPGGRPLRRGRHFAHPVVINPARVYEPAGH